jgi:hypothetical protein
MRLETTTSWLTASAALLATAVMAGTMSAAPASAAAAAAPITNQTIFANDSDGMLWRLELNPNGTMWGRTSVAMGEVASDHDGARLVYTRPGTSDPTDDQVWLRDAGGKTRFLGMGHLATFSPGRTGVTIARYVSEGRDPNSNSPAHDELSVYRFADGHVFTLSPHVDGIVDRRIRNSHDGKSRYLLANDWVKGTSMLMRHDRATDTTKTVRSLADQKDCTDFEILPSGSNALLACGTHMLTIRLSTGAITHRTELPSGVTVDNLDGRLNSTTMLLSVKSGTGHSLAALDLTTMRTRTMPGTAGYTNAVAPY